MSKLEMLESFHKTFNHPINEGLENRKLNRLRLSLLFEELEELAEALGERECFETMCHNVSINPKGGNYEDKNDIEVLDAYVDISYILNGSVIANGFKDVFNEAFKRVHASNMSKACKTIEEAEATVKAYLRKGIATYYQEVGEYYIVYRKKDNKILKSINYNRVDLQNLCT